jgi:hypothetical protein
MDPYEHADMWLDVWKQLPSGVQQGVTLGIDGDDPCEPRIAIFRRRNGTREWRFPVLSNGLISEEAVWLLCLD